MALLQRLEQISIHAPTRGATVYPFSKLEIAVISIHAPTRGATPSDNNFSISLLISIHAPTRGATCPHYIIYLLITDFNPRSYKRSDDMRMPFHLSIKLFQSTLLQEERRASPLVNKAVTYFNPRSYKRSDFPWNSRGGEWHYFNPRSYKRSDTDKIANIDSNYISIHAPTRGATFTHFCTHIPYTISIHAPTRGATQ